jgi:DNA-3-methyladenine glycosylase I
VSGPVAGIDGVIRCPWGNSAADYVGYHDDEWGRPLQTDDAMFERLTLEGFQSGLSWLIVLRKRPAFRAAFAGFEIARVAEFDEADVERLMADAGIVRNRAKILATIGNAAVAAELPGGLLRHVMSFAPNPPPSAPRLSADIPAQTDSSRALARDLKKRGVRFVGPTTAYALMQATGIVNDHLVGCVSRDRWAKELSGR